MMNPHSSYPTSLFSIYKSISQNYQLIFRLAKREIVGRYKGSFIGLGWSFVIPILMLVVYTFVFSVVFKARWGVGGGESKTQFAIVLFTGLILHGLLAEVFNRAPGLILSNINYVKKVVFPLEVLPIVSLCVAFFHSFISIVVLLIAVGIFNGFVYWTSIFLPIVIAPLILLILGVAWLLASLGVFLRDIGQTIGIITLVMMFFAPVFYPITALPEKYQFWLMINPLTFIIEQAREVVIWGHTPNWLGLATYTVLSLMMVWIGYAWFQKTRKGFADVV